VSAARSSRGKTRRGTSYPRGSQVIDLSGSMFGMGYDARERSDRAGRMEPAPQRERVRLSGSPRGEAPQERGYRYGDSNPGPVAENHVSCPLDDSGTGSPDPLILSSAGKRVNRGPHGG